MPNQNDQNQVRKAPDGLSLAEIRSARERLAERVRETPVWEWRQRDGGPWSADARVFWKLELLQFAGSFKPRGALLTMLEMSRAQLEAGVTAVSAGNHAMAVAYAARALGTSAKVVMPSTANPARVEACRALGAEVVSVADVHAAFAEAQRIADAEGRSLVHPFEGRAVVLGTATLGLEFAEQVRELDVVIVPIGGGGLCAGVAVAIKQLRPTCRVIGVEPVGADTMSRSFAAGSPQSIDRVRTIADSLGAPFAMPYTFALCVDFVDEIVRVEDDELRAAMGVLFREAKLAVEPAGAAATAALLQLERTAPKRLRGRIGAIICGANIDLATFARECRG